MKKNVLFILMATALLWSCGGQNTAKQEQTNVQEQEVIAEAPTVVAIADFKDMAELLLGKEIILEGTVIHVCKHGGKKMFITADDPDVRIKITAGEESVSFDTELEGSYVKIHGIVEQMETDEMGEGKLAGEGEGEESKHEEDADHENIYHAPQYSVVVIDYAVEETIPE